MNLTMHILLTAALETDWWQSAGLDLAAPITVLSLVLLSLFFAVQRGVWVPRKHYEDIKADRDVWRDTAQQSMKSQNTMQEAMKELTDTYGELSTRVLLALPKAAQIRAIVEESQAAHAAQGGTTNVV